MKNNICAINNPTSNTFEQRRCTGEQRQLWQGDTACNQSHRQKRQHQGIAAL